MDKNQKVVGCGTYTKAPSMWGTAFGPAQPIMVVKFSTIGPELRGGGFGAVCPRCKNRVSDNDKPGVCPNCRQALDWSRVEYDRTSMGRMIG